MAEKKIRDREQKIIAEALRVERANMRRDTARAKTRSEVRGGGAKPWRQKGTGRARQGSIRAVQWRGGGRAVGTALRNHHRKINKKVRRQALESVLEWKKDTERIVLDALSFDAPSTKQFRTFLEGRNMDGKVLFVYNSGDELENAVKSARNLPNVVMIHADKMNLQALLQTDWLVTTPAIAEQLNLAN